jgi:hypothetical protein
MIITRIRKRRVRRMRMLKDREDYGQEKRTIVNSKKKIKNKKRNITRKK